jgi:polysaccharide biosynthesis/export protein
MTGFFRNKVFIFSLTILGILSSCITHKNVEYLQSPSTDIDTFVEPQVSEYKLKPDDELYIQISSLDDAASNIFYNTSQQVFSIGTIQPYGASLLSYSVDKSGFLQLPVIGELFVKDKTITQVSEMLKDSLVNVLSQPVVSVKLVNRFISVIGEVKAPGHYVFTQDKLTLLDAISLAGDITDYGNRKDVILVRNENGKNLRINLDLTKTDILVSEYYNLRPNDIVYVMPLKKKFWNLREFPYTILLSTITTALLIYTAIQK